jgi:hypothetical protein
LLFLSLSLENLKKNLIAQDNFFVLGETAIPYQVGIAISFFSYENT